MTKVCEQCGDEFKTGNRNQKCCSRQCSMKNPERRHQLGNWKRESAVPLTPCPICGEGFRPSTNRQISCSIKCGQEIMCQRVRDSGLDTFFFDHETPITAYWAGFIAADGSVDFSNDHCRLRIGLARKDRGHLEKFQKDIGAHHVKIRDYINGRKEYLGSALEFSNNDMKNGLKRWGIVPRKTYCGKPPRSVPLEILPHFVRGYIDGDGGASLRDVKGRKSPEPIVDISCPRAMADWFSESSPIPSYTRSIYTKELDDGREWEFCRVIWKGWKRVQPLLTWLEYESKTLPHLDRKQSAALDILSLPSPKIGRPFK